MGKRIIRILHVKLKAFPAISSNSGKGNKKQYPYNSSMHMPGLLDSLLSSQQSELFLSCLSSSRCTASFGLLEQLAGQRELGCAIGGHDTPVTLVSFSSAVADGCRLLRLVEGFKDKGVDAVCQYAADGVVVVCLCVLRACDGGAIVGSTWMKVSIVHASRILRPSTHHPSASQSHPPRIRWHSGSPRQSEYEQELVECRRRRS